MLKARRCVCVKMTLDMVRVDILSIKVVIESITHDHWLNFIQL